MLHRILGRKENIEFGQMDYVLVLINDKQFKIIYRIENVIIM